MELFLYKCEECGSCKFSKQDRGRKWYADRCGGCQGWSYYEKVVITSIECDESIGIFGSPHYGFALEEKKKKDGNSNTRTNQEAKADVDRSEY